MTEQLKNYSFSYIEGGYSTIQAYDYINAQIEAKKHKAKHDITKTINYGSIKEGNFV